MCPSQVQNIHTHSLNMSHGIRTPSPSYLIPVSGGHTSQVGPAHSRSDSLPAEAYLQSKSPSPPGVSPLLVRKVYSPTHTVTAPQQRHGSQELLSPKEHLPDPMAEFDPSDLQWQNNALPETHRLSVAW